MTYTAIPIRPGVILDDTALASGGYASDSDKIVFWLGRPQAMGGWRTVMTNLLGKTRAMLEFATTEGVPQLAIATSRKLYVVRSGRLYDITPERSSGSLGSNPVATVSGSQTVTITQTSHGARSGDIVFLGGLDAVGGVQIGRPSGTLGSSPFISTAGSNQVTVSHVGHGLASNDIVFFASATGFGGIPAGDLNLSSGLRVQVVNQDVYYIYPATTATSSATGGGTPTFRYAKGYSAVVTDGDHYTIQAPNVATSTVASGGGANGRFSWDLTAGRDDAGFSSGGFGTGRFGAGLFGIGEGLNLSPVKMRLWSLSKFGQDLVANLVGGGIYYWSANLPASRAALLANSPARANWTIVSPERSVIAFGCTDTNGNFDPLLIRHTPPELATVWTPTTTNAARVERAEEGSRLITALSTSRGIIFWSDTACYELRFVGRLDQVYKPEVVGVGNGIIGPNAAAEVGDVVYWFDPNLQLAMFDGGRARPIQFPMHTYLIKTVNRSQGEKIYAFPDRDYPAVMWLIPQVTPASLEGVECNGYVRFDVNEARGDPLAGWSRGTFDRTAWSDRRTFRFPMAVSATGTLYEHNDGMSDDNGPIYRYIDYAPIEIDEGGDGELKVSRVILDTERSEAMSVTLRAKEYPESREEIVEGPREIQPGEEFKDFELRARQLGMRIEGSTRTFWRLGKIKVDISPISQRGI